MAANTTSLGAWAVVKHDTPQIFLAENAQVIRDILDGKTGPHRDIILLNAAAAIVAGQGAANLKEGLAVAAQSIDSGTAREKLNALVKMTSA